jgi:diguanylate cyclase (GGDEF)-like protein
VIRSIAWLLKQRLRKTDTVGRYGGEEFLVLLPGMHAEQARQLLDAIRVDFGQIRHSVHGNSFACTFSGGVCEWSAGLGAEALIKHADEVLYQSKHAGRNQVGVLTPS